MRNNQSGLIQLLDDIRHRKRLTRTGNAEKRLTLVAFPESLYQFGNRLRLVAGGFVFGV